MNRRTRAGVFGMVNLSRVPDYGERYPTELNMQLILSFDTKAGTFYIGQSKDGRFHPICNNESLGSYAKHWQATEDLSMNATFSVLHSTTGEVLDTSRLGIPEDPSEWERIR